MGYLIKTKKLFHYGLRIIIEKLLERELLKQLRNGIVSTNSVKYQTIKETLMKISYYVQILHLLEKLIVD
jgi:hypothetical protein